MFAAGFLLRTPLGGGAYSALPDPLAGFHGTSQGWEGRNERGGREGKERGEKGRERSPFFRM